MASRGPIAMRNTARRKRRNMFSLPVLQAPEKRIYLIFPETVDCANGRIPMEEGRIVAQSCHVGRMLEFNQAASEYREITTITLGVRNSKELNKIAGDLNEEFWDRYAEFRDHNPGLYGSNDRVLTAVAVGPITRDEVENAIGHLELYQKRD